MAKVPSESKVKAIKKRVENTIEQKKSSQAKLGKKFDYDTRVGVIPEAVWKRHKGGVK